MKKGFYLLAVISFALFVISTVNLGRQLSDKKILTFPEIKGFADTEPNSDYQKLVEKFRTRIEGYNLSGQKNNNYYFWCSFLVTVLTAASTLVSAIQAAKKEPANAQRFAVVLAVLTFCSTITNFASTHFNELKTEAFKNAANTNTMRSKFYADYKQADAATKSIVIHDYESELDTAPAG